MITEDAHINSSKVTLGSKINNYVVLTKLRLSSLVVFSAAIGYLIGKTTFVWLDFIYLIIGGFLVTGSSNGFNQVIEIDTDKKMKRTKNRPLVTGAMSKLEGIIVSSLFGIIGLILLYQINLLSCVLGLFALFSYVVIYTPMKKISPLAVFVGAFPGSVPPMLGYVAASGAFELEAGMLFLVQFMWQFPHFWSIAWKLDADYKSAGFKMLPSHFGKTKSSAFQIFLYSLFLIQTSWGLWATEITGVFSAIVASVLSIALCIPACKLYKTLEDKFALQLMFGSFIYLPLVLILYLIDKI